MGDFKSLDEIAAEMELERQKPRCPPQNAAEANAAMVRQRRLAREQQPAQEQPQYIPEQPQEQPEELGLSYPDVKIPLSNGEPAPAAAEAVTEQPVQSNGNGSKPDWNTTGYPPIAAHCGVTRRHIARIMCGTRKPSLDVLQKMASFYGVSLDEMHSKLGL